MTCLNTHTHLGWCKLVSINLQPSLRWRVVQMHTFTDFFDWFIPQRNAERRSSVLCYDIVKGQIRSGGLYAWSRYIKNMYVIFITFYLSALTQFHPIYACEKRVLRVCAAFGWPPKVIQRIVIWVWSAAKGGQRLPNLCKIRTSLLLRLFFSSRANWIAALPASPWSSKSWEWELKAAVL